MAEKKGRFIKGAILGGLLGSVAALLLAPKSGKALRKDLKTTAERISDRLMEVRKELMQNAVSLSKKGKAKLSKGVAQTIADAEKMAGKLEKQARHFKKYGNSVKSSVVKETREMVHESAGLLRKLKGQAEHGTKAVAKKTKPAVKAVKKAVRKAKPKARRRGRK